jgi:hypothetical protein
VLKQHNQYRILLDSAAAVLPAAMDASMLAYSTPSSMLESAGRQDEVRARTKRSQSTHAPQQRQQVVCSLSCLLAYSTGVVSQHLLCWLQLC